MFYHRLIDWVSCSSTFLSIWIWVRVEIALWGRTVSGCCESKDASILLAVAPRALLSAYDGTPSWLMCIMLSVESKMLEIFLNESLMRWISHESWKLTELFSMTWLSNVRDESRLDGGRAMSTSWFTCSWCWGKYSSTLLFKGISFFSLNVCLFWSMGTFVSLGSSNWASFFSNYFFLVAMLRWRPSESSGASPSFFFAK